MNAVRQKCRPKHQVLVLKCYPKFQKNTVEVKPNPSELSYLLYYASTRRSKLQKVCDFLDKRTTSDVWKKRIGNVQVTLQILKALIEKCPRDLPLFRGAALRCLRTVLKSADLTLVEGSVATFESFCAHQDPATLAADQDYIKQYEEIVRLYADFASKDVAEAKSPTNWPQAIRYRKAGLRAIKSVASSDSLNSETGRQLSVIIPAILLNLFSNDGQILERLEQRDEEKEEFEKELAFRRRQSVSTVRTAETGEGDALAAAGTIEDADKLAEEEVEIVALQALRNIFSAVNRAQLRLATSTVLTFVTSQHKPASSANATVDEARWPLSGSWETTLFTMLCVWAPVQDRYVILVAAVESLARTPLDEHDLDKQLVLTEIVQSLLRSGISLIGLSVMDVLIRLIQHVLQLLQIDSAPASTNDAPQEGNGDTVSEKGTGAAQRGSTPAPNGVATEASSTRRLLLDRLQKSIGSLAAHIYYSDQICDMLSAILTRLKPPAPSGTASTAAAIEDPEKAVDAVASAASLSERHNANGFFSFDTARLTALAAIKDILVMANTKNVGGPSKTVGRTRVGANIWEGTQWLLRDPNEQVRRAYVDALVTWLHLEIQKDDLKVSEERLTSRREKRESSGKNGSLARRAVSSASHREKSPRRLRSTFLQLLHLAVYENAHQFSDSEEEFLSLHLLLSTLVQKLGVNSLRSGLPMIMRLQEDIQGVENPVTKIRFGSLVHGYLWAIETYFDFDTSPVGRAINNEIARRRDKGLWMKNVQIPPIPLAQIPAAAASAQSAISPELAQQESLRPFDGRQALVERIAEAYAVRLLSPATSPPGSPGRSFSVPVLTATMPNGNDKPTEALPPKIVEQLLSDWSRETCIANTTRDTGSSASMSGSRTGTGYVSGTRNLLAVNIPAASISDIEVPSPRGHHTHTHHHISSAYGLLGGPHGGFPASRRNSATPTPGGSSSVRSALRVEDLKRALSGSKPIAFPIVERRSIEDDAITDSASDSMMSADLSNSEVSFITADNESVHRDGTNTPRAASSKGYGGEDEDVPPVPPLPESVRGSGSSPTAASPAITTPTTLGSSQGQDQRRPYTAPAQETGNGAPPGPPPSTGHGSVRKSRSLKRGSFGTASQGREKNRTVSMASSGGLTTVSKPDFTGLLSRIEIAEEDLDMPRGMEAPY